MISIDFYRRVGLTVVALVFPLLSGCLDSNFQTHEEPVTVSPPPPPSASITPGTIIEVNSLEKGLCADTLGDERLVDEVIVRDCNSPHEFEVAGLMIREDVTGIEFPGRLDLISNAQIGCETAFEQQVGTAYFDSAAEIDLDTITPSANTWDEGDRTVICLIVGQDGGVLNKPASQY